METKTNQLSNKDKTFRVTSAIAPRSLNKIRKALSEYGRKAEAAHSIGVSQATIHNILRTGRGLRTHVEALQQFVNQ